MVTINPIDGASDAAQIHRAFVTQVVKAINAGYSSDVQIFLVMRKLLSKTEFKELKIEGAVRNYMRRLSSRGYIYESRSTNRWTWLSKAGWPLNDEDAIVDTFINDKALRLDDLLRPAG
jgi:hypothetical protein